MLGVYNVLKPTGWTSSDVVVKIKHMVREYTGDKKIKVGHLGTLDPAGSGVLPVCVGSATKLFDYYVGMDKIYRTTFTFGKSTDTLDSYGAVVESCGNIPNIHDIKIALESFKGEIMQVPPKYSRISVGGVRAVDAVRKGIELDIKARKVKVYSIDILNYNSGVLTLNIHCSGGTYIRSICRDLAEMLGSCAYMSSIIRLQNKSFCIENAKTLDEINSDIVGTIITLDKLFENMQKVNLTSDKEKKLLNGVRIAKQGINGDYIIVIEDKIFGICADVKDYTEVKVRLWN